MSRFSIASYFICTAFRKFSAWEWRNIARQWADEGGKLLICDRFLLLSWFRFDWPDWFTFWIDDDLDKISVINVAWKLENFLISSSSQTIWVYLLMSFLVRFWSSDSIFASFRSADSIFSRSWFLKSIWIFVTSSDVWLIADNWSNSNI